MHDDSARGTTRRDMLLSSAGAVAAVALTRSPLEAQVATARAAQQAPAAPLASLADYENAARTRMTPMAYEYVSGGAGDELTLGWNRDAYSGIKLRGRVLVDVSKIDTAIRLLGRDHAHPILLAPTAYHKLVHRDGELATARGAGAMRTPMIVSSFATTKIEDIGRAATSPLWFQLYVQPDRGFTRALVERAEGAGCQALCLTVDTPVLGARNRETRIGFRLPAGMTRANLEDLNRDVAAATHRPPEGQIYSAVLEPRLTWKDVEWLRGFAKVPVLLKGILDADDARQAMESGVNGIIVSNHGARNLDTVPATITALPRVAEAVGGRMPIIVDGGIRRGTDVLKALALGASAVAIGRPYLYGLAVNGSAGVSHVIEILRTELEMAMALTGRTTIAAIDRSVLWT
ncbi:MAG TPA: alpha-hydroxy acid oxidase [Gemmatimonadaceae bacterium]|nr:alpha-hydroxy acid oxidase [Gemmatimonadaceae bacterium]